MCVFLYNSTLFYSVSLIYFFWAATAFDIFGTDNAEELLTCGFQYPSLPISILHFVARIFGRKWYNFALLNAGESGKHWNLQAFFTLVNITYNFSKVRVGLPEVWSSRQWYNQKCLLNISKQLWQMPGLLHGHSRWLILVCQLLLSFRIEKLIQ